MVSIKKRLKGYILLESLIALGVLVSIASLVLTQLNHQHRIMVEQLRQQEVLTVATMAVQTGQSNLSLNGVSVQVVRTDRTITIYDKERVVIGLEKD